MGKSRHVEPTSRPGAQAKFYSQYCSERTYPSTKIIAYFPGLA
jgi:hypothetical protein